MERTTIEAAAMTLLMLGAGMHQVPYMLRARKEGIRTVAVDADSNAAGALLADAFLQFPISNHLSNLQVDELLSLLTKESISGVLVAGVELAVLGSRISSRLNLPGICEQTAMKATDKLLRLETLAASGAFVPRFAEVTSNGLPADLAGSKCVLKPRFGSGSRGVSIINSEQDFERAFREAAAAAVDQQVYVEEYLPGVEYSIEAFMLEGEPLLFCAARRDMAVTDNGKIVDWGSSTDPHDPTIPQLLMALQDATRAIGLGTGPAKADLLVTEGQVAVLEVAARSAPLAPLIAEQIAGFDAVGIQLKFALGEPLRSTPNPRPVDAWLPWVHRYAVPRRGILRKLEVNEDVTNMPGALVVMPILRNRLPVEVDPARPGDRPFYVAATGTSVQAAETNATNLIQSVGLDYA